MPTNINIIHTNYSGEVYDNILTKAALGNEVAESGIVHIVPGIKKKLSIPRMQVSGHVLQKRKSRIAIDGSDSQGTVNHDERELDPQDVMLYLEFNPATYESTWKKYQPQGKLVFQQLPPEVQIKMLGQIMDVGATELGDAYINCTKGSGDYDFFHGFVNRIMGDKDTVFVQTSETSWIKRLGTVKKGVPDEIVDNPNLKIIMNTRDYTEYDEELKKQDFKNVDPTKKIEQAFDSTKIIRLVKWPRGLVVATLASMDENSNLWAAVNLEEDEDTLQVDKVTNASEFYFVKLLMKVDVNIAWGEYCVVLDKRTQGTATLDSTTISAVGKVSTYSQTTTLSDNVTYTISTTGAILGQTLTVANNQSAVKKITIGTVEIAKGESATFRYCYNSEGNLAWTVIA